MIKSFQNFNESKNDCVFYKIIENEYLICDVNCCSESDRTFDMKFFDLANNKKLLKILNLNYYEDILKFNISLSHSDEKIFNKLKKNPTIRLLVQNYDKLVDVLEIFKPDDIRVSVRKYNL